jgi:hypothetical protein
MAFSTGPRRATVWAARERVLADATGIAPEALAAMVETELDRCDGVLFTATPTEELDDISRWQRLADAAWCGQVRAIVAAHNRMGRSEREFLACEVSLALNTSTASAESVVATALLVGQLPGLVEAVEVGMLTVRHAYAVLDVLPGSGLTVEQQHAVLTIALARYTDQTPAQLRTLLRKLVATVDAAAAQARERARTAQRSVQIYAVEVGQGVIVAREPLAMVEAVRASLEAGLVGDSEDSKEARTFDLLVDLLTGGEAVGGGWDAQVVVPFSVAVGGDLEVAEIPGLGPVLPSTARELLAQARTVTQVAVDEDGHVIAVGPALPGPAACATDRDPLRWLEALATPPSLDVPADGAGYRPGPRLRRWLEARDRTCVFPGCTRPAGRTDKDHREEWPRGSTSADNLECLCRHHHRAKHAVFQVMKLPDGTIRWITRGGWWFDRPPQGY